MLQSAQTSERAINFICRRCKVHSYSISRPFRRRLLEDLLFQVLDRAGPRLGFGLLELLDDVVVDLRRLRRATSRDVVLGLFDLFFGRLSLSVFARIEKPT